ncbi:MAG: ParB/RepB/Spo0J family partition protein [Thermodesulfobacteriota bacterium]|nr:ParB/RepB/Spo0J family partition protein [Thermodesulfobacteriota bacterium]
MSRRKVLGKGLSALIPDIESNNETKNDYIFCNIDNIQPNKFQPRKDFDESKIDTLISSIKEKGIIQPLIAREILFGYELIAGERRWLAAKKAGFKEVPIIVKRVSDVEALELSLIENIQREDLGPLEEAEAYKRLIEEFNLTQEEIGKKVGKDRSTVTNSVRLLKLPEEIRDGLSKNIITMGHARTLLSLDTLSKQRDAYRKITREGLSVRQTEKLVKRLKRGKVRLPPEKQDDIYLVSIKDNLVRRLGTQVKIVRKKGGSGRIEIAFYSNEDLDRIINTLKRI